MAKVTFLLGLCGSGKTHHSDRLAQDTRAVVFESLVGNNTFDELRKTLAEGKNCVVEEIHLRFEEDRRAIMEFVNCVPGIQFEWLCFENDIESANWNITHRTNKGGGEGHRAINSRVHGRYTYPEGARVIPITRIG